MKQVRDYQMSQLVKVKNPITGEIIEAEVVDNCGKVLAVSLQFTDLEGNLRSASYALTDVGEFPLSCAWLEDREVWGYKAIGGAWEVLE